MDGPFEFDRKNNNEGKIGIRYLTDDGDGFCRVCVRVGEVPACGLAPKDSSHPRTILWRIVSRCQGANTHTCACGTEDASESFELSVG